MKSSPDVLHGSHPERILPQVFGAVCTTSRAHRKRVLALEFLAKMLPQIIKQSEHADFDPAEALQCRYLRLTGSNITALEEMCRKDGNEIDIHPHLHIDDVSKFVFDKPNHEPVEIEGHVKVSTRQQ